MEEERLFKACKEGKCWSTGGLNKRDLEEYAMRESLIQPNESLDRKELCDIIIRYKRSVQRGGGLLGGKKPTVVKNNGAYEVNRWHNKQGELHRKGGPALVIKKNKTKVAEFWLINGKLHRTGGDNYHLSAPAYIVYKDSKSSPPKYLKKTTYKNGKLVKNYQVIGSVPRDLDKLILAELTE